MPFLQTAKGRGEAVGLQSHARSNVGLVANSRLAASGYVSAGPLGSKAKSIAASALRSQVGFERGASAGDPPTSLLPQLSGNSQLTFR